MKKTQTQQNTLFRPDLRDSFVVSFFYKGHRVEVYLLRATYSVKVKRHFETRLRVHAVSYTNGQETKDFGNVTYHEGGVVGFDSAHGWYDEDSDKEQFKHIGSVINQVTYWIDAQRESK